MGRYDKSFERKTAEMTGRPKLACLVGGWKKTTNTIENHLAP
jgi:hypothetical protein